MADRHGIGPALALAASGLALALLAGPARADLDPCPTLRGSHGAVDAATRIAAAACEEHQHWYRPFIDTEGRLVGSVVREAETTRLGNGQPAWLRVRDYWRGSGLLGQVASRPGAADCAYAGEHAAAPACRAFVVDTPWSAAFVSWVMRRAALPGFRGSASHVDFVRAAYRDPEGSPYRIVDPRVAAPARGDLLCYVRGSGRTYGFSGLATLLSGPGAGLGMHCDVVVAAAAEGQAAARLVGGNVFDGVTMRHLPLGPGGRLAALEVPSVDDRACAPDATATCSANRQDWAALLQLRPQAELDRLAPPPPLDGPAPQAPAPACCVYCVVGSGVPRCPADAASGARPREDGGG